MFHGSMVALVTPMHEATHGNAALDYESLARLVEFHIENGTDAIVAVGTTGESATLDIKEHCSVLREVISQVRGRIPVIAGTGANSTTEAIELTRAAMQAGADACLLVTPYYNKPTQEGLYLHYKAVAEAVPIPQILYNVPGRTACDMLPIQWNACPMYPTSSASRKPPATSRAAGKFWSAAATKLMCIPVMMPPPWN